MRARSGSLSTAARKFWGSSTFAAAVAAMLPFLGSVAWAVSDEADPAAALRLIKIIPIPPTPQNSVGGMFSFDISWVDPANGLYYLADRSNKALDVIDTTGAFTGGKTDTLFGQIGGAAFGFAGDVLNPNGLSNTAISGPDGVVAGFPCIFAGDAGSRLISINGAASFVQPVSIVNTGGQFRVDEMAIDTKDGLVIAANNAEPVPFTSIYTYNKSTCVLSNQIKTFFNALPGGHVATNGIEQPVWEPSTQRFYVSLPEIDGPGDGTGINGAVAKINPLTGAIETFYPVNYMQPAGLTVGPNGDLLVGSNSVFDFSGKKCGAVVPAPSPTGNDLLGKPLPASVTPAKPALCTGIGNPQEAICNPGRGCTPANGSLVAVAGAGGGDEVYFNAGDGNYYVTAGNNPPGPTFGVIASGVNTPANTLTQLVPTLPPDPAAVGVHGAGTVHSIAACGQTPNGPCTTNKVYVPLPANTSYVDQFGNTCAQGCVAVFSAQ